MSITNIRRMLCLLLTFVAIGAVAQVKVEPGVSQELAQYRAKHVRDVTYDLSFKIPGKKIYGVEIEEEITFKWDGEGDLQLDFQGKLTYALIKNTHLDNSCYQDGPSDGAYYEIGGTRTCGRGSWEESQMS